MPRPSHVHTLPFFWLPLTRRSLLSLAISLDHLCKCAALGLKSQTTSAVRWMKSHYPGRPLPYGPRRETPLPPKARSYTTDVMSNRERDCRCRSATRRQSCLFCDAPDD